MTPRKEICDNTVMWYIVLTVLIINDKKRIYAISKADMLKSLLSKRSQDDHISHLLVIPGQTLKLPEFPPCKISFSLYTAPISV